MSAEYEKIIHTNEDKGFQLRLTFGEFREKFYLHIRKYFLSYEGEYVSSREGISMEASFDNIAALIEGLAGVCSASEVKQILENTHAKLSRESS